MTTASVLIVEDEAVTALDLQELLEHAGYVVTAVAATAADALKAIEARRPDLALVDIQLADDIDGITLAAELIRRTECVVIFLTAHGDEAIVGRAEALMPAAYLLKPFNEREVTIAVRLALAKHASDRALLASERRYASTLAGITDGVFVMDLSERIVLLNPAAAALIGWEHTSAVGHMFADVAQVTPGPPDPIYEQAAGAPPEPWWLLTRRDGQSRAVAYAKAPLIDDGSATTGTVLVMRDITAQRQAAAERRELEQHLQALQRVESLGVIASGIAHDFNNILLIVSGYTELAQIEIDPASSAYALLNEAMHGLGRAGELTRQLLLYAGRGPMTVQDIDLNALIRDMHALIQAALGPLIELALNCADQLPPIQGDPTQLRQVILNLITNAAEAMNEHGGCVTVTTGIVAVTAGADVPTPGPYVELRISDQGRGIDATTRARMFEPFYTTKQSGRGLGLATVQGIVRRHHGAIRVISDPHAGTTMQILLPAHPRTSTTWGQPGSGEQPAASRATPDLDRSFGTLLIIDDEADVRHVAARLLERLGYRSVLAADGRTGITRLQQNPGEFRGVLIDLSMPGERGTAVADSIHALQPQLPIILMSGYLEDAVMDAAPITRALGFLQKPFTLASLTRALSTAGISGARA